MNAQRFLPTLTLLTLLLAMFTAWLIVPARADIIRVPDDYPTIQAAVDNAGAGDTIQVAADTYYENVLVNTRVTIVGEDAATTIVDGGGNDVVFNIQADDVELRELTIRNEHSQSGVTVDYPYDGLTIRNSRLVDNAVGVSVYEADGNTFEDNIFINNQMYGISVQVSSGTVIKDNQISGSAYCVEIADSSNCQVVNNTLSSASYAIYTVYSNDNNVSANILTSNSWNIYLTYSNSNIIGFNDMSGGSVGTQIMYSQGNSVLNNTVNDCSYGIYLGYCGANTVSGNTASLNDWGVELYNSDGCTVKENTISDGAWGIYVVVGSEGNSIYHNNFVNNAKGAYQGLFLSNTWRTPTTPYEGSYWSSYTGEDTNGDGIGDTKLPAETVDWYPLMNPLGGVIDVAVTNVTVAVSEAISGAPVSITVTVENQGTWAQTFDVTAKYNDTAIETKTVSNLLAGADKNLTFEWETIGVEPCTNYTIKAEAGPLPGEDDVADNNFTDGTVKITLPDLNGDGKVNILDLAIAGKAYGTQPGDPQWNPIADINKDGIVNITDVTAVAVHYGKTCG